MSRLRTLRLHWLPLLALISLLAIAACRSDSGTANPTAASNTGGSTGASASPASGGNGGSTTQAPTKEVGVTDSEILLGSHFPLTGPASVYVPIQRTVDAIFKKVNEEGGINGRKIKMLFEDDGYVPNRAVEATKKLVEQDQIFALYLGVGTAAHSAVGDYLVEKGVPDMMILSGAVKWNYPLGPSTKKTVFGYQPDYNTDAKILAKYALDTFGKTKKMGLIYQNDDFGRDYVQGYDEAFKKANVPGFVASEAVDAAATDLSAQVLKMRDAGVEVLFAALTSGPYAKLINAKAGLNYNVQMVSSYVVNDPTLFKLSQPQDVEGMVVTGFFPLFDDLTAPGIQAHYDLLKKYSGGQEPGNFTVFAQGATEVMVDILKRAGKNLTRKSLIDAAESTRGFKMSFGNEVTITPEDHRVFKALRIVKASGGKLSFVTPFQTAD